MAYVVTINEYRHEVREKVASGVDADNKKIYKIKLVNSFYTRVEADAYVANFRLKNSVGEKVKASQGKIEMSEALRAYCFQIMEDKKYDAKHPTIYRIQAWLNKSQYSKLVNKELGSITFEVIDDFIESREDEDISASTINRELNILSPFFNFCKKQYKLKHWDNPVESCNRPKSDDARDRTLTEEERKILEDACKNSGSSMLYFSFVLALETAIRRNELCNIKWSDVVLDGANSHINLRKETTKTKKARTIPLSQVAQDLLKELKIWQKGRQVREELLRERRQNKEDIYDFSYVLSGVTPRSIGQAFRRVLEITPVKDFRFHDCRHCATTNLSQYFDMLELSSITGHSDPRMLKRYFNPHGARLSSKMNKAISAGLTK